MKIELYVNDRFCIETYIIDSVVYKTTDFIVLEQVFRDTKCIVWETPSPRTKKNHLLESNKSYGFIFFSSFSYFCFPSHIFSFLCNTIPPMFECHFFASLLFLFIKYFNSWESYFAVLLRKYYIVFVYIWLFCLRCRSFFKDFSFDPPFLQDILSGFLNNEVSLVFDWK